MSSKGSTLFVHDRLFHYGGAGIVLSQLISKHGDKNSIIFVLFSPFQEFSGCPVVTALPSRINKQIVHAQDSQWRFIRWFFDYRNLMPLYPVLVWMLRQKIKKHTPQHLVVSSFAAVKNVTHPSITAKKTLYLHSPMQYIRENYDEYCMKLTGFKKFIFVIVTRYLRKRDKRTRIYDTYTANSHYTASCAQKLYGRDNVTVIYPALPELYRETNPIAPAHDYYVYIGRLVNFVRETDRIITLCSDLSLPLLVVGTGPDEEYLKSIAGPTITFLGLIKDDAKKIQLLTQSKGLINLAKESLGIVTMEALAVGTPVLGYSQGGIVELMTDEAMGVCAADKQQKTLDRAVQDFISRSYDREKIKQLFYKHYDSVGSII